MFDLKLKSFFIVEKSIFTSQNTTFELKKGGLSGNQTHDPWICNQPLSG